MGQAVARELELWSNEWVPSAPIIWTTPEEFRSSITTAIDEFYVNLCNGELWTIYWCAGLGTVAAGPIIIDGEYERAKIFIECLKRRMGEAAPNGTIFYSSSAGGIYGASEDTLISEESNVAVSSSYGAMKFHVENLFRQWASDAHGRVAIGRISNLFGQGQNIQKQQGLISAACLALLKQQPLGIFVSLDTTRNYLYVADAAKIITHFTMKVMRMPVGSQELKIVCSPYNLSIAAVLYEIRKVFGRKPAVGFGNRLEMPTYTRNLSLMSIRHVELDPLQFTPMSIAIAETRRELLRELMDGLLAP